MFRKYGQNFANIIILFWIGGKSQKQNENLMILTRWRPLLQIQTQQKSSQNFAKFIREKLHIESLF